MNGKFILILCFLFFSCSASASDQEASTDCDNGSNMERANCLDGKLSTAQGDLRNLIAQMRASLVNPDDELAAQDLWSQYVEKECSSREFVTGWGAKVEFDSCLIEFTRQRIDDLETYHFCTEGGCPARKPEKK